MEVVLRGFAQVGCGFTAILSHAHIEFDNLALVKRIEVCLLHFCDMDKDIRCCAVRRDKAVAFGGIKPFHCSTHCLHVLIKVAAVGITDRSRNHPAGRPDLRNFYRFFCFYGQEGF